MIVGERVMLDDLPSEDGVPLCPECREPLDLCWDVVACMECPWWAYA